MVPAAELLPDVLPTERLTATGKAVPAVREQLRRIPDARERVVSVVFCWVQIVGPIYLAVRLNHPLMWIAAFLLCGRGFALLNILGHEAAHRLLFSKKSVNDFVGRWFLAYPAFTPIDLYRRSHMAHHRDEFGPEEPDMNLYSGYPITRGVAAAQAHARRARQLAVGRTLKASAEGGAQADRRPHDPRRASS